MRMIGHDPALHWILLSSTACIVHASRYGSWLPGARTDKYGMGDENWKILYNISQIHRCYDHSKPQANSQLARQSRLSEIEPPTYPLCSRTDSRIQSIGLNGLKEKLFEADGVRNCAGLDDDRRLTNYSGVLSLPILMSTKEQIRQPRRLPLPGRLEVRLRASRETTKSAPYLRALLPTPDTVLKRPSTLSLSDHRHTST